MTAKDIMKELQDFGDAQTKKTYIKHGAKEPVFGVKVADLKKILKKTKKNHELSIALYDTGNSDAMYLAGLMADENQISKKQLEHWADKAYWQYLSEYTVPWVAAETPFGFELGLKWIDSKEETVAAGGWSTLASYAGVHEDEDLDIVTYKKLLDRIEKEIHNSPNRVKYTMNGFVISIAGYITELTDRCREVGKVIGKITVDMNGTACKVPLAVDYIQKIADRGSLGKKRKTSRC